MAWDMPSSLLDFIFNSLLLATLWINSLTDGVSASSSSSSSITRWNQPISATPPSIEFPVISTSTPAYLVPLQLGHPPQTLFLFPDTGSYATWANCSSLSTIKQTHRTFHSSRSKTFSPLPCSSSSSSLCINNCSSPFCKFKHDYADGSTASGFWARESVTVNLNNGKTAQVSNIMFGCSYSQLSNLENADGILGLSANYPSFTSHMIQRFGEKFSYCLPGIGKPDGYLVFGENQRRKPAFLEYTKLKATGRPFFYVGISGVEIDGIRLKIPAFVWEFDVTDKSGGVMLDTGTTFTYFPAAAFRRIHSAFAEFFRDYDEVKITRSDICFNSSAPEFEEARFPRLTIEFAGKARFSPPADNYFYGDVEDEGIKCLAFRAIAQSEGSIIGSVLQRDFYWEYDFGSQRLGFAPAQCG